MMKKHLAKAVLASLFALSFNGNAFAAEAQASLDEFVLDTMVVTASRIPTTITDAKADVSVVSRDVIEEMHIDNVEDALRTVPGVQFLNYGATSTNANMDAIRINGSKDVVILVDGVRVTDFQGAGGSTYANVAQMTNMDNIERIEVLRGSAATVYGSGAKGGVINIITRDINSAKSSLDFSKGSFGKESYKFHTQGRRDKFAYNAYYSKSIRGDVKDGEGKTWEGNDDSKSSGVKFVYDFDDQNKLTLSYDKNKSEYGGREYIKEYAGLYNGDFESKTITVKYDTEISEKWSNSLTYRKNDVTSNYVKVGKTPVDYHADNTYDFISDQVTLNTSRHTVVMGLDYSKGSGFTAPNSTSPKNICKMENYSYYIQDDWEIIPHVTLSGGLRYDKPENDSVEIDTNTAKSYKLSWDITDNDTVYAGRSDFFILPSMDQYNNLEWGNKKLKPAKGQTTSVGYNKKFDENNILTFNWFKTESDTTIGFDDEGQYQNFENALSKGWNAQFMTQLNDNWNATIGWSHLHYSCKGDTYEMGYYPKDYATFGVHYTKDKLTAGLDGFYFMRKVNPDYAHKQGWPKNNYGIYNLSVNYSPTDNLTFYGKVDNILDTLWAERTHVVHGGNPGEWYAMPGRSFVLGMQLKF